MTAKAGWIDVHHRSATRGLSAAGFAEAFSNHAAASALVTADSEDGAVAVLTTKVMPLSSSPAVFAIALERRSSEAQALLRSESLVVHLLTADQLGVAQWRGSQFARTDLEWGRLFTGEPFVIGPPVWIRGDVLQRVETGRTTLVIVHATLASYPPTGMTRAKSWPGPLLKLRTEWHELTEASRLSCLDTPGSPE
jgi:flavin reductase (DIM6/NTAB) family NADH-FMN oxidoreductase RutF